MGGPEIMAYSLNVFHHIAMALMFKYIFVATPVGSAPLGYESRWSEEGFNSKAESLARASSVQNQQ